MHALSGTRFIPIKQKGEPQTLHDYYGLVGLNRSCLVHMHMHVHIIMMFMTDFQEFKSCVHVIDHKCMGPRVLNDKEVESHIHDHSSRPQSVNKTQILHTLANNYGRVGYKAILHE